MSGETNKAELTEKIQYLVAKLIATSPAGKGLQLIGGFRYRMLDNSPRRSDDIDYHWDNDLEEKRNELYGLFMRRLLPEVRRTTGYDGSVRNTDAPGQGSHAVKVLELSFFNISVPGSRIELPVEITWIARKDPPQAMSAGGNIILTVSDQDMAESKVITLLNRPFVKARDFVDLFLFHSCLKYDSRQRLVAKFVDVGITAENLSERMNSLRTGSLVHIKNISEVINDQLDIDAKETLLAGGGAETVYKSVMNILESLVLLNRKPPALPGDK